jgi:hypothetical protein
MFRVPLCVARQQLVHERQEPIPPPGLLLERLAPCTGDGIHLRLTVGRSLLPGPFDPAPLFQAHQGRVHGARVQRKRAVGDLLQA